MVERRKNRSMACAAVILAAVLLVSYVGAYILFLSPVTESIADGTGAIHNITTAHYRWPITHHYLESQFWRSLFAPANQLDRKVRPEKWEPRE